MDPCLSKSVKNWGCRGDLKFTKIKKIRVNKLWRHDAPSDVVCSTGTSGLHDYPFNLFIYFISLFFGNVVYWPNFSYFFFSSFCDHNVNFTNTTSVRIGGSRERARPTHPPRVQILSFRHTKFLKRNCLGSQRPLRGSRPLRKILDSPLVRDLTCWHNRKSCRNTMFG